LCVTPGVLPPLLALVLVQLVVHLLLLHTQDANQPPMGPLSNPADPHRLDPFVVQSLLMLML
jgi:hypothetical protein